MIKVRSLQLEKGDGTEDVAQVVNGEPQSSSSAVFAIFCFLAVVACVQAALTACFHRSGWQIMIPADDKVMPVRLLG